MVYIARSDGTVIIDTLIDTKGFDRGFSNVRSQFSKLGTSLRKLGAAIGIAFGLQQVVQFGVESSQAARTLESALRGLQSIVEGQGRSFQAAKEFIEEYTQDGLIPATNAITAYKNLAMRGYDDTQIRQVMVALKDASAYGRQASYTMGEAVQSATEGLKNENSILVDNAGVTKNVAKMWEEYAASIGTTTNNLTQQQKIQAEVAGILEESKYQTGDAASVTSTLSGQIQQLSFNFNNLKVAAGGIVNPIIQAVLPAINTAINAFTKLANTIASVFSLIFGKVSTKNTSMANTIDSVAAGYDAAADAAGDFGGAASAAAKKAKKALMGFDEINKLAAPDASGGGGGSSGGGTGGGASAGNISAEATVEDTISPKIQAIVDKIRELLEPLRNIDFTPATQAFDRLKKAIEPLTAKLFEGLEWAWYNLLVPLAQWTIEDLLPACLNLLSDSLGLLNTVIDGLKPLATWLWEEFLKPMAEWTGGIIVDSINSLADALSRISNWISENQESIKNFAIILGSIAGSYGAVALIANIAAAIKDVLLLSSGASIAMSPLLGTIMAWVSKIGMAFSSIGTWITGTLVPAVTAALTSIAGLLGISVGWLVAIVAAVAAAVAAIVIYWDEIVAAVKTVWEKVKKIWNIVAGWFDENVIQPVAEFFTNLWNSISSWASQAWEDIKEFFAPAVQWFSDLLNSVKQTFDDIFYNIGVIVSGCWEIIKAVWAIVSGWFDENVIQPVAEFFSGLWDSISSWAINAWDDITATFTSISNWFNDNVVKPVSDLFESLWGNISEWASDMWDDICKIFNGVVGFFKGILNGVIGALNDAISWIFGGINKILSSLQGISVLGITPFSGLRTIAVPQIPYLAQGAVIPPNAPFMAVLGDQRHGTNIEAPLSTIQEAVALVMQDQTAAIMAGFNASVGVQREILQAVLGIQIGDEVIASAYDRYQTKLAIQRGG